jgi:hypothetical protein
MTKEDFMRNKILLVFSIFVLLYALQPKIVNAETRKVFDDPKVIEGSNTDASCNGIFTQEALDLIDECLGYFRILAPVVLILMIAVDFFTAVIGMEPPGGRDEAMRKAVSRTTKRIIAAILLFLIPTIVKVLLSMDGIKGTIVSDPNCGLLSNVVEETEMI